MKERHLLGNVKHEMKKTSSSKLDLEESKNAAIAKNTGKNQAKSTSGGWKSRRSSISRLPSSIKDIVGESFIEDDADDQQKGDRNATSDSKQK